MSAAERMRRMRQRKREEKEREQYEELVHFLVNTPFPSCTSDEEKIREFNKKVKLKKKENMKSDSEPIAPVIPEEEKKRKNAEKCKRYREAMKLKTETIEAEKRRANAERNKKYRWRKKIEMEMKKARIAEGLEPPEEPMYIDFETECIRAEKRRANAERNKKYRLRKKIEMEMKRARIAEGLEPPEEEPMYIDFETENIMAEKRRANAERNKKYRLRKKIEMEMKRASVAGGVEPPEEPVCEEVEAAMEANAERDNIYHLNKDIEMEMKRVPSPFSFYGDFTHFLSKI